MIEKMRRLWSEEELTLALGLYLITPYSKINKNNPLVIKLSEFLDRTPGSVSRKLGNFASFDDKVKASGRKGLNNVGKLDRVIWSRFVKDNINFDIQGLYLSIVNLGNECNIDISFLIDENQLTSSIDHDPTIVDCNSQKTETLVLVRQRQLQGYFRKAVLANYETQCLLSGCRVPALLDAAHILPWNEHLDLRLRLDNSLLLDKFMHTAYDKNLISITPDSKVVLSNHFRQNLGLKNEKFRHYVLGLEGLHLNFSRLRVKPNKEFLYIRHQEFVAMNKD